MKGVVGMPAYIMYRPTAMKKQAMMMLAMLKVSM